MKTPTSKLPDLFARWSKAGRPILTGGPKPLPAEPVRKAEQVAASQEWEDEGGAIKPSATPKLPL
jgi:hypothetical protein